MDIKKIGMISAVVLAFLVAMTASAMAAAPTAPTNVSSTHTAGVSSTNTTINMNWTASTDADDDLAGYIIKWDDTQNSVFAAGTVLSAASTTTSSESLADGSWYFHIRAINNAGNLSAVVTAGPFIISTQPSISEISPSSGATGTAVTITGTGFANDASVKMGTADMTSVNPVSDKEITANVPSSLSVGAYTVTVTSGGKYATKSNAFTVTSSSGNNAPQVSAGKDKQTDVGTAVSFNDATASDSDGDTLTYAWSVSEAPAGAVAGTDYTLTSTSSLNAVEFKPLTDKAKGSFTLKLTVNDRETSASDTVLVVVGKVIGDVNGDGKLDVGDAVSVFTALVGKSTGKLTSFVNADGKITPADAAFVLMQLAK
jgi:hypothetical protein